MIVVLLVCFLMYWVFTIPVDMLSTYAFNIFMPNKYIVSETLNSVIIYIPFVVSHSIVSFFCGLVISRFRINYSINRVGIMIVIVGSLPFSILSLYNQKFDVLIYNIIIINTFVYLFGCVGAKIGSPSNKL